MSNPIPDLPILGEPLIAEFANTLYVDRSQRLDVLDHPAWISAWLQQAPCAAGLGAPRRVSAEDAARLLVLRDALRTLLTRRSDTGCTAEIAIINEAAQSTARRVLTVTAAGELAVADGARPSGIDVVLSAIAGQVIDAVASETLLLNQTCSRPDCNLFYFRDHHRRRYCNMRCANADRQARYHTRLAAHSTLIVGAPNHTPQP